MRTLFIAISLLASTAAFSQNASQIAVSSEKVKVNGNIMHVHKVKGGETLYSLAKAYSVAVDDIVRHNESLKNGLKEGTTIYIPSATVPSAATTSTTATAVADNAINSVSSGSQATLKGWELNEENIRKYSKKRHKVKSGQKIGDIAAKYNVTVESIVAMNNLGSTTLQKKQILQIPNGLFLALMDSMDEKAATPSVPIQETTDKDKEEEAAPAQETDQNAQLFGSNSLAFILPLNLKDTLGANPNYMDFYAGALMAADSLKRMGDDVSITLIDQNSFNAAQMPQGTIIGPVRSSDMKQFLPLAGKENTVVSPMDMNTGGLVAGNSNFVQIAPSMDDQTANLMDLLATRTSLGNSVMIIYERNGADLALVEKVKELSNERGIIFNTLSYNILEGREIMEKIKDALEPGLDNLVLVPSNSEAFVNDVVRNLNLLYTNPLEENRRSVVLFGTPRWRNFESIEVDYFHKMNLHLSIPYYVDYNRKEVKNFLMKYRALFNGEPTPYAFQGYDITMMSMGHGEAAIQSKYSFKKDNAGDGIRNTGTTNIVYNKDYTISVIE